jgi:hypothetical protein
MYLASLIGTFVTICICSVIMWALGRRFGRKGGGSRAKTLVFAILWSIPFCWIFLAGGGGGHGGPSAIPVPAWIVVLVIAVQLFDLIAPMLGGTQMYSRVPGGDWLMMSILLFIGLVIPVVVFIVTARSFQTAQATSAQAGPNA